MKCCCCDKLLNNFESTRKSRATGEYLDMCNKCYSTIDDTVKTINKESFEEDDVPDEEFIVVDNLWEEDDWSAPERDDD